MPFRNDTLSQSSRTSMSANYTRKLRYRTLLENLSTVVVSYSKEEDKVLCNYTDAIQRILVWEDEAGSNVECMDKTSQIVKEVRDLHRQGGVEEKDPGESYLDSKVLRAASDVTVRCSEAVSGNVNAYDKHELARHIAENPDFWNFTFPQEVPVVAHVFGAFTAVAQRPVRVRRQQVEKQQLGQLKEPEKVDKLEKTDEGSQMVTRVNRFISKWYKQHHKPLSYFHTVLDPGSFSKSVENIYNVSFLVRDGHISVTLDEEHGLPFITPLSATQKERVDVSDEKQFIVSIDMQRWQDLVLAFGIEKPMMVLKNK